MSGILVVDDDEMSRSMLEIILQDAGYLVECAGDGAEALQTARSRVPDLIITDVLMPLIDGFELCRICKEDAALRQVPIILCSGDYAQDQDKILGMSLGASRYLLKPFSRETILATVKDVLQECNQEGGRNDDATIDEQMQLLRSYNEVLFHKLEAKMQDLQQIISEHQKSEDALKKMQAQIVQQEKMASIGQLAAGVAHEINNPMGFITSNLTSLGRYADRLDEYIAALQQSLFSCPTHPDTGDLDKLRQKLKVDYIISDVRELVNESLDGANRVRRIVQDLKSFSRVDQAECCQTNLNEALETTINIAWNELKYIATLERDFGEIPDIVCFPQQLNQVFLNLLVNSAQAMDKQGNIIVRTWSDGENVLVSVADTGKGMSDEVRKCIFDPFFTTKEAGKGTGLGLSISADIVRKHGGQISVESCVGVGSTFTVSLPILRPLS
jgi:signal transduction histidine kinase